MLPEILLSKGEVNVDMLNFAVSPGKNTITIVHCQSLIPNENMCDKTGVHTIYRFIVSKPFYTCRRIVLYTGMHREKGEKSPTIYKAKVLGL